MSAVTPFTTEFVRRTASLGAADDTGGWLAGGAALLVAFVVSVVLTPAVRDLARRLRFVDAVGSPRKIHQVPTPRVGGVAILVGFYAALAVVLSYDPDLRARLWQQPELVVTFLAGGIAIGLVGLVDDIRGIRARHKLVLQLAVAGALSAAGFAIDAIVLPTGTVVHLGVLGIPLTMLWMAGVMNATNLVDGLDGLAAGVSVVALATLFVFSSMMASPELSLHSLALAGAVLGFLVYNFSPASVFMGDTGSLFIGYCLSVLAIVAARTTPAGATATTIEPWLPILVMGFPLTDTLLAMGRRALRGRPLFSADREHLHHRLLGLGMSQRRAALVLYAASGLLGLGAIVIRVGDTTTAVAASLALVAAAVLGLWHLGVLRVRLDSLVATRSRNLRLRSRLHASLLHIRRARSLQTLVQSAGAIGGVVGARHVHVRVGSAASEPPARTGDGPLSVRYLLRDGPMCIGALELQWADRLHELDADEALALDKICDELARAACRLRSSSGWERRRSAG